MFFEPIGTVVALRVARLLRNVNLGIFGKHRIGHSESATCQTRTKTRQLHSVHFVELDDIYLADLIAFCGTRARIGHILHREFNWDS